MVVAKSLNIQLERMTAQYGVAVFNKFDLCMDDEVDPFELLGKIEEENKKKKEESKPVVEEKPEKVAKQDKPSKPSGKKASAPQEEKSKSVEEKENRREGECTGNCRIKFKF